MPWRAGDLLWVHIRSAFHGKKRQGVALLLYDDKGDTPYVRVLDASDLDNTKVMILQKQDLDLLMPYTGTD